MDNVFALPENDLAEIRRIASAAGFRSEQEFVVEAVEDKILSLKKTLFVSIASDVSRGLDGNKIKREDILADFDNRGRR